jgi:hypothetical protein
MKYRPKINATTRRYIPEGSNLHTRRRENLKSHTLDIKFEDFAFGGYQAVTCGQMT